MRIPLTPKKPKAGPEEIRVSKLLTNFQVKKDERGTMCIGQWMNKCVRRVPSAHRFNLASSSNPFIIFIGVSWSLRHGEAGFWNHTTSFRKKILHSKPLYKWPYKWPFPLGLMKNSVSEVFHPPRVKPSTPSRFAPRCRTKLPHVHDAKRNQLHRWMREGRQPTPVPSL